MGGQRVPEPPDTTELAEEYVSPGPRPRQSDGADGARSEHGSLVRCEYDLLTSEATKGGPANAGGAVSEDGHGASVNQEGTETEEEGGETLQRALTARETNGGDTEARGPPKRLRALKACEDGRGRGGWDKNPPTARETRIQGADGGDGEPMGGQRMS